MIVGIKYWVWFCDAMTETSRRDFPAYQIYDSEPRFNSL